MPQGVPLDRHKIHIQIWEARDRSGKVKIHQKKFAKSLHLSGPHLCRVLKDFEETGRIKKVGSSYRNVGVYVIRDPAGFVEDNGLN